MVNQITVHRLFLWFTKYWTSPQFVNYFPGMAIFRRKPTNHEDMYRNTNIIFWNKWKLIKHCEVATSCDRVTFYAWVSLSSFWSSISVIYFGHQSRYSPLEIFQKNIFFDLPPITLVLVYWPLFTQFTSIHLYLPQFIVI